MRLLICRRRLICIPVSSLPNCPAARERWASRWNVKEYLDVPLFGLGSIPACFSGHPDPQSFAVTLSMSIDKLDLLTDDGSFSTTGSLKCIILMKQHVPAVLMLNKTQRTMGCTESKKDEELHQTCFLWFCFILSPVGSTSRVTDDICMYIYIYIYISVYEIMVMQWTYISAIWLQVCLIKPSITGRWL